MAKDKTIKATVAVNDLKANLVLLQNTVERKNTIPILGNVMIEANKADGVIKLTGTNLDQSLACEIEAKVHRSGVTTVSALRLLRIAESCTADGAVELEQVNTTLHVAQGDLQYGLPAWDADAFPELPKFGATPFRIKSDALRTLVNRTEFAVTKGQSRYTLSGAKVSGDESGVTMTTTDGHRLAIARANGQTAGKKFDALIPRDALLLASQVSRRVPVVSFGFTTDRFFLKAGALRLISRVLSGQFPAIEKAIPAKAERLVEVDAKQLASALKCVAFMADARSHMVLLTFAEGEIVVSAETPDEGTGKQSVKAASQGKPVSIGFNASYLREFLDRIGGRVETELTDKNTQIIMRPVADAALAEYRYIVMPMRT